MESLKLWFRGEDDNTGVVQEEHPAIHGLGAGLIVTSVVMPVAVTLWTGLRIWTRRIRKVSPFQTEDILCYIALLFFWGTGINYICMVIIGGAGWHLKQLQQFHIARFSQMVFAAQVLYAFTLGFTKICIIWMIKRVFFGHSYSYVPYVVLAFTIAWMMQTILTGVLICRPITMNWDPSARGHCGNQPMAFAAVSIVDIATDLAIFILPIKMVLRLQMKTVYKIALGCVFSIGMITIAFTAIRLYFIFGIDFTDLTYSSLPASIISTIQQGVAIAVASAPLLRPVFDRTIGTWLSASLGSARRTTRSQTASSTKASATGSGLRSMSRGKPMGSKNFQRITESEENLRWELDIMDNGETLTHVGQQNDSNILDINNPPAGHIVVTRLTQISRQD